MSKTSEKKINLSHASTSMPSSLKVKVSMETFLEKLKVFLIVFSDILAQPIFESEKIINEKLTGSLAQKFQGYLEPIVDLKHPNISDNSDKFFLEIRSRETLEFKKYLTGAKTKFVDEMKKIAEYENGTFIKLSSFSSKEQNNSIDILDTLALESIESLAKAAAFKTLDYNTTFFIAETFLDKAFKVVNPCSYYQVISKIKNFAGGIFTGIHKFLPFVVSVENHKKEVIDQFIKVIALTLTNPKSDVPADVLVKIISSSLLATGYPVSSYPEEAEITVSSSVDKKNITGNSNYYVYDGSFAGGLAYTLTGDNNGNSHAD